MRGLRGPIATRVARRRVLSALAGRPYCSTVRLADELGLDPSTCRAIVDALEEAGRIRCDTGPAWALTATGWAELRRLRRLRRRPELRRGNRAA